jgi:hypothetical protein
MRKCSKANTARKRVTTTTTAAAAAAVNVYLNFCQPGPYFRGSDCADLCVGQSTQIAIAAAGYWAGIVEGHIATSYT